MTGRSVKKSPTLLQHSASTETTPSDHLRRRVRRSKLLDPIAKRQWLTLLPYLSPSDRARLEEILLAETAPPPQP